MAKGQNCKGIQTPKYDGPELCATLSYTEMVPATGGQVGPREITKKVEITGRLNNPRKSEQAVLVELCAKVKAQHPTAKLVTFKRKEGRA